MSEMPRISEIQRAVAGAWNISLSDMVGQDRHRPFAHPRQVAMYLSRRLTTQSLHQIGRHFNRDHTTVIHGTRAVAERRKSDPALDKAIRALANQIVGGLA